MKKILWLFLFFFILFFDFKSNLKAETLKKVLILPFEIYSQQDLSYLKKAIPEMLTSRLFSPNKIQVIDPEVVEEELKGYSKIDKKLAETLGQKLSADYVIFGSVTVAGEVVSIDAQIMDLKGEKKPAQFFQEIKGLSDLIPQLTRFAKKSKNYIEGKEEDFYKEDLSLAIAGPYYIPGKAHPERGYFGYIPYPGRQPVEEPPVERAKPRFSDPEDPIYESGLSKNLVIDLSGNKPRVGFAKSEEEKAKGNQTQAPPPYLSYYPPQPYYNYSPPPYYYFSSKPQQEEGLFSKMKRWIWPFGEDEARPVYPQPIYPQPVPVYPQAGPQVPSPSQSQKANQPTNLSTPQVQTSIPPTSSQPNLAPSPQPIPNPPSSATSSTSANNPWRWE